MLKNWFWHNNTIMTGTSWCAILVESNIAGGMGFAPRKGATAVTVQFALFFA
jgi:hypothetical protein